jgi:hypothetical protein
VKRQAVSLLELIFVIFLISIVLSLAKYKNHISKLELATKKLIFYMKYTRYKAMLDNRYSVDDNMWFKERWTIKFQKCSKTIGGLYFVIFRDINHKGSPNKIECLKDPLSNKYLYSHYDCDPSQDESKYILLTKEYGITNIDISCNDTSTLGQLSFGYDGRVYSRLGTEPEDIYKYEIKSICTVKLEDKNGNFSIIQINPRTGYISRVK